MTLTEYISQIKPRRYVNVKLEQNECSVYEDYKGHCVVVHCFPKYTYFVKEGTRRLFTTDSDGNPRVPSVFTLNFEANELS